MSNYDSILKEKVKYEDPLPLITESEKKKFPWLLIDVILISLVLIISYIIYYNTILAPDKIFYQDMKFLIEKYNPIIEPLNLKEINSMTRVEGILKLNNKEYNYIITKNDNKTKLDFSNQNNTLTYYKSDDEQYIKLSNYISDYIKLNNSTIKNKEQIETSLSAINKEKYKKNIYLDNKIPIVEANLILKSEDINNIIGISNYEAILTFKNHALTNQIINIKIAITNTKTNKRYLITYQNNELTFKSEEKEPIKLILTNKNNDFTLKFYQNDTIYSVLTGTKESADYLYTYQIIDKIYNINLRITKQENNYQYELTSKIENNNITTENSASLTINNKEEIILEEDITKAKAYSTFSQEEKEQYKISLDTFTLDLRNFIEKHQQNIDNINTNNNNN